jgi:hypothetical protein
MNRAIMNYAPILFDYRPPGGESSILIFRFFLSVGCGILHIRSGSLLPREGEAGPVSGG